MSVIKIVRFKCDICEKEFEDKKSVRETSVPCYGGSDGCYHDYQLLDLCYECSEKLRKVIWDHFAQISNTYGYVSIGRKSDKE